MPADVVICASQSVTRAGLAAMVQMGGIEVVAQLGSVRSLTQWLQTQQADLAIVELLAMDARELSELLTLLQDAEEDLSEDSFATGEFVAEDSLSVLLLLESSSEWDAIARQSVAALMSTGQVSLLPMGVSLDELRSAIASILNDLCVIHPSFCELLFSVSDISFGLGSSELEPLTPREIEVLNQLVDGLSNRAIAQTLKISEHTVKFHISAILSKLAVSSRTEAVAVGIRNGLVIL